MAAAAQVHAVIGTMAAARAAAEAETVDAQRATVTAVVGEYGGKPGAEADLPGMLSQILRDGPEVGVHTFICLTPSRASHAAYRPMRYAKQLASATMSAGDSSSFIGVDAASSLRELQLLAANEDRGLLQRSTTIAEPPPVDPTSPPRPRQARGTRQMSVIADPDKLRELAKRLKHAGEQIEHAQRQGLGALQSSGWNDRERQRFEADLSRDMRAAAAIGRKLQNDYPKALERKAKALDDFRR